MKNCADFKAQFQENPQARPPSLQIGNCTKPWIYVEHEHMSAAAIHYSEKNFTVDCMQLGTYRLGLWLFPIRLDKQFTKNEYALSTEDLLGDVHFAAKLACAMKMSNAGTTGWVYALPQLLSLHRLQEAHLDGLLQLPARAEAAILGAKAIVMLNIPAEKCAGSGLDNGSSVYFLPFVVRLPAVDPIMRPWILSSVDKALIDWIHASGLTLPGFQGILPLVSPFSDIAKSINKDSYPGRCIEFSALPIGLQTEISACESAMNQDDRLAAQVS